MAEEKYDSHEAYCPWTHVCNSCWTTPRYCDECEGCPGCTSDKCEVFGYCRGCHGCAKEALGDLCP